MKFAESEGIDDRSWTSRSARDQSFGRVDDQNKSVLAQACVFRRPFPRDVLPGTSISLLPVNADGMVDMPSDLRTYIPSQVDPELLRQYHSQAADHWLSVGEYRERLHHLLKAGRLWEAEAMVASRGIASLGTADRELLEMLMSLDNATERYRGRLVHAQAEVARRAGDLDLAIRKALMRSSADQAERSDRRAWCEG